MSLKHGNWDFDLLALLGLKVSPFTATSTTQNILWSAKELSSKLQFWYGCCLSDRVKPPTAHATGRNLPTPLLSHLLQTVGYNDLCERTCLLGLLRYIRVL